MLLHLLSDGPQSFNVIHVMFCVVVSYKLSFYKAIFVPNAAFTIDRVQRKFDSSYFPILQLRDRHIHQLDWDWEGLRRSPLLKCSTMSPLHGENFLYTKVYIIHEPKPKYHMLDLTSLVRKVRNTSQCKSTKKKHSELYEMVVRTNIWIINHFKASGDLNSKWTNHYVPYSLCSFPDKCDSSRTSNYFVTVKLPHNFHW